VYSLHYSYPEIFYVVTPLLIALGAYKLLFYKRGRYRYPLTSFLSGTIGHAQHPHTIVFFLMRCVLLTILMFFIAGPEWVDKTSLIKGEGRDIIIGIDVSGSMQVFDDLRDRRSRIQVAKEEAEKFIKKRTDDPIGIVAFAKDALSLCPLTLDKNMLHNIVYNLDIGSIDPNGTSLGTGLATAINRLRTSPSKTKIIILLTDGEPTPSTEKINSDAALALAKEFNIKVYTIGIGNEDGGFAPGPFGTVQRYDFKLDVSLLKKIAHETGGRFFRANSPTDMKKIYATIDQLETTTYETSIFQQRHAAFMPFFWIALALLVLELFMMMFVWRVIS
jgi:Ca-activated chloride channel family protein